MKRTLVLNRETLAALTTDELTGVRGAADQINTNLTVCDRNRCISKLVSCFYC